MSNNTLEINGTDAAVLYRACAIAAKSTEQRLKQNPGNRYRRFIEAEGDEYRAQMKGLAVVFPTLKDEGDE